MGVHTEQRHKQVLTTTQSPFYLPQAGTTGYILETCPRAAKCARISSSAHASAADPKGVAQADTNFLAASMSSASLGPVCFSEGRAMQACTRRTCWHNCFVTSPRFLPVLSWEEAHELSAGTYPFSQTHMQQNQTLTINYFVSAGPFPYACSRVCQLEQEFSPCFMHIKHTAVLGISASTLSKRVQLKHLEPGAQARQALGRDGGRVVAAEVRQHDQHPPHKGGRRRFRKAVLAA